MTRYWMTNSDRVAARDDMVTEQERTVCRPVVVIDPEDREQVDRLIDAALAHGYQFGRAGSASMTDALRSLIAPPKPPEPTGLGAVVEDADGTQWVRIQCGNYSRPWLYRGAVNHPLHKWDDLAVVKVLSEGVTS